MVNTAKGSIAMDAESTPEFRNVPWSDTYIHTYIHTDRQINRHTYIHTDIHTDRQTDRQTDIHTWREAKRDGEIVTLDNMRGSVDAVVKGDVIRHVRTGISEQ